MRDRVDAINVTDQQSSAMRLGSLATCRLLKEKGLESVFQVTCRDRNRIALQSDLLSAYVLGIFSERCRACGNCLLADYGGICPITMCAKSLVNGPCGGYKDGKCETSSERNCAWIMIYDRLAKQGKLDKMREISTLKDYSVQSHPARQINEAYTKKRSWLKPKPDLSYPALFQRPGSNFGQVQHLHSIVCVLLFQPVFKHGHAVRAADANRLRVFR